MDAIYHQIDQTSKNEFFYETYSGDGAGDAPHFHKNYEIIVAAEGGGICTVGERKYTLKTGEFVFVSPFQSHSLEVCGDGKLVVINFHEHIILSISQIIDKKRLTNALFTTTDTEFEQLIKNLGEQFSDKKVAYRRIEPVSLRLRIKGFLYVVLSKTLESGEWTNIPATDTVIVEVIQYISDNFTNDISLKTIARDRGYNYQYLSRTFNKIVGINFKRLVNQYRMEYAFAKLQDTNLPLSQIAFESGFQSIRSFDHVCRSVYNKSPMELRRNQKSKVD